MGCASSKPIEVAVDVYRPPPSSFAVFDINAIQEPWLMADDAHEEHKEKPMHVPVAILDKLNKLESDGPRSWEEVSKALEDLKPKLTNPAPPPPNPAPTPPLQPPAQNSPTPTVEKPRKSPSFHTLAELEAKISAKPSEVTRTEFKKTERVKPDSKVVSVPPPESGGYKPLRENIFIVRDKLEREKEGKAPVKWDPLSDYPEKCPPGGSDSVVLYTTSLGGVRRTYEDSNRVRAILETHRVVFEERDVSLHGGFRSELRELLGEGVVVPRLFVKGRYVGGAEEVVGLNETGRLGRLMSWARVERREGVGKACEGCGGARFVPCLDCGGSCKVVVGDARERCPECNENGLVLCPICH
ncbi:glutaredoxin family protein [Actinidia rufa]|uniref:Glutaredoxin family protein n=1 Tax=Actinidia rufa TaxID=165716 RepID=A0A7J0DP00_9ERIC|nr:glutaredoxin family protein [Actinidia rufa]